MAHGQPWEAVEPTPARKKIPNENDPLVEKAQGKSRLCACTGLEALTGLPGWLDQLQQDFGHRLLWLLFIVQHLLKGFVTSFVGQADPYLYKSYGVPAPRMQVFTSITSLPWAMKPVIGLISDVFPVFGYNKAPYILMSTLFGATAFACVGLLPQGTLSLLGLVMCIFLTNLQVSTCDLLSEAKYAEKIQTKPASGPNLLTYVWFGLSIGGLVAAMGCGTVIETLGPKAPYVIAFVPALAVLWPVLAGYLEESKLTAEEVQVVRDRFFQQKEACALCLIMFMGTVVLTVCGLVYEDPLVNGIVSIVLAVIIIASFSIVLSPVIAKFNAFSVLQSALSLSTGGATFYFYTDTPEQYPEGPHFQPFFFNTVMGISGALCTLFGIYCYQRYMQSWRYRHLLLVSNLAFSALCMVDLLMFTRMNVRMGIPDHVFILGSSVLESVIAQWMWMPQVVILSYLCPKGMEATMYALLAGCANLGNSIASNIGALLLQALDCRPSGAVGESAQFENLWIASAVSTILPLGTIFLIFWLVPDARQNERIMATETDSDATSGSLWRKWTGDGN